MKTNQNFPGGVEVQNKKTFHGGSMDIFWNCTLLKVYMTCYYYESPHSTIFTKKCMPGEGWGSWGQFGLSYFREFATDFSDTSRVN